MVTTRSWAISFLKISTRHDLAILPRFNLQLHSTEHHTMCHFVTRRYHDEIRTAGAMGLQLGLAPISYLLVVKVGPTYYLPSTMSLFFLFD